MAISEEIFEVAGNRGAEIRKGGHAVTAEYDACQGRICVGPGNGIMIVIPAPLLEGLAAAGQADLSDIEITPGGLSLHWPWLDADIYICVRADARRLWIESLDGRAAGFCGPTRVNDSKDRSRT
ncbi:MAG: DUF2442 domain-containing protein [Paracoccus sp. (in: a-proteobacteria)]|nr:DUF2442 domain-containing protein [Paracoccus sp. (in: a-proteobacteria)]